MSGTRRLKLSELPGDEDGNNKTAGDSAVTTAEKKLNRKLQQSIIKLVHIW
jgi:hypothetical protein